MAATGKVKVNKAGPAITDGQEITIEVLPSGRVRPLEVRVSNGDRLAWVNMADTQCTVSFDKAPCPLDHVHAPCEFTLPPAYVVSGKVKGEYEYTVRCKGKRHRGGPKIIITG